MKISILGAGAMGSRIAGRFLNNGHSVTVWNRTGERNRPLIELGAISADSPAAAAVNADIVISMVRDDKASRYIWLDKDVGALPTLSGNTIGVESSTVSTGWARELASSFRNSGIGFLEMPVVGSRLQAETGKLILLAGGERQVLDRAGPVLSLLGEEICHAGPAGSGAAMKLLVNAMLGVQTVMAGELIAGIRNLGLEPDYAVQLLSRMPSCSMAAANAMRGMLAKDFAPAFPVDLMIKDLNYLKAVSDNLPVNETVRSVFLKAEAAGYGEENITTVSKLYSIQGYETDR